MLINDYKALFGTAILQKKCYYIYKNRLGGRYEEDNNVVIYNNNIFI